MISNAGNAPAADLELPTLIDLMACDQDFDVRFLPFLKSIRTKHYKKKSPKNPMVGTRR